MSPSGEFDDKYVLFQRINPSNDDFIMSLTFANKKNK